MRSDRELAEAALARANEAYDLSDRILRRDLGAGPFLAGFVDRFQDGVWAAIEDIIEFIHRLDEEVSERKRRRVKFLERLRKRRRRFRRWSRKTTYGACTER